MDEKTVSTQINETRIGYLDTLRIIAIFGIIILHLSALNWYSTDINSLEWNTFNVYDSCVRCMVPVFVMISGALFLSKRYTIKELYRQKILRIALSFVLWSLIYAIVFCHDKGVRTIISQIVTGHFHLWFLLMIIQLYMLVPIFKKITENEKIMKYFLIVFFVYQIIIPQIVTILNTLGQSSIASIINTNYNKLQLLFGYSGYFVLGYFLLNKDFSKVQRRIIYLAGLICIILTAVLTVVESNKFGVAKSTYYNYFSLNVFVSAIAIFLFSKYNFKENSGIRLISKQCFGIYLLHVLVYRLLFKICNINILSFNSILSIPVYAILTFIISFAISYCISKIPVLNKYII